MKKIACALLMVSALAGLCFAGQMVEKTTSGNIKAVSVSVDNDTITAKYKSLDGTSGITDNVTVVGSDNNTCTLVIKDGLITQQTCP